MSFFRNPIWLGRMDRTAASTAVVVSNLSTETFESYSVGSYSDGSTLTGGSGWAAGAPVFTGGTIGTRTFAEGAKKYLSFTAGTYRRSLSVGSNWSVLRIGLLVAQTPNGTSSISIGGGGRALLSANSGIANGFNSGASTVNNVGVNYVGRNWVINAWDLSYDSGASGAFYYGTGGIGPYRKAGATITQETGTSNPAVWAPTNTGTQRKQPIYLQIEKGSPNYSLKVIAKTYAGGDNIINFTSAQFESGLQDPSTAPTINGVNFALFGPMTATVSEVAGAFDTIELYFNFTTFPLEVYEIAAYKLS